MMEGQKVKWELFNLTNDPKEEHDVAKEHPEIVAEMKKVSKTGSKASQTVLMVTTMEVSRH